MKLKELFFCYYPVTEADFAEWWKSGLFVFDANALLDLYGLQEETQQQLFTFLESVKERIWVPHQAALEFSRNRVFVVDLQVRKYKNVITRLEKLIPDLQAQAEYAQKELATPDVSEAIQEVALRVSSSFKTLRSKIDESVEPLRAEVTQLIEQLQVEQDKLAALAEDDPILVRITQLFGENVGDPYDEAALKKIYADGHMRYAADPQVPLGHKDKDKKGNAIYGDLLVWKQTILKAQQGKYPILMVNSEAKADWVETIGENKKPRKELVQEMHEEAGVPFYLYSLTQFMKSAKKYLEAPFSSDALSDANRVEEDEVFRQTTNELSITGRRRISFEFLLLWQRMENLLNEALDTLGPNSSEYQFPQVLDLLVVNDVISRQLHNRIFWIHRLRNSIVHGKDIVVPEANVREAIVDMRKMMGELEAMSTAGVQAAVIAVGMFLSKLYPQTTVSTQRDRPHFFLQEGDKHIAVDTVFIEDINGVAVSTLNSALNIGDSLVASGNVDRFALIIVAKDQDVAVKSSIPHSRLPLTPHKDIWAGYLEYGQFIPVTNDHLIDPLFG